MPWRGTDRKSLAPAQERIPSGKDVVTANKALLAEHGPELFDRARELGRSIAFEASVAGGIPIIANISQCLSANQIQSLDGILNGTTNFILSKMHEEGMSYADALKLGWVGLEPTTNALKGRCSTIELPTLGKRSGKVSLKRIVASGFEGSLWQTNILAQASA